MVLAAEDLLAAGTAQADECALLMSKTLLHLPMRNELTMKNQAIGSVVAEVSRSMRCVVRAQIAFASLLLCTAIRQAYALDVVNVGGNGANGADGAAIGQAGGNGGDGGNSTAIAGLNGQVSNTAQATGGNGGEGGHGGPGSASVISGAGGFGGNGGDATAIAVTSVFGTPAKAMSRAQGGRSGGGLWPGLNGGAGISSGGDAGIAGSATALAQGHSTASTPAGTLAVDVSAVAIGGSGSGAWSEFASGSNGGSALASAYGSATNGDVRVSANVQGGHGGQGFSQANGGSGASVSLANAVSGNTTGALMFEQIASGGNGGNAESGGFVGAAGNASATLSVADTAASSMAVTHRVTGGNGAGNWGGFTSAGGAAYSSIQASSIGALNLEGQAYGGRGGDSGTNAGYGDGGAATSILQGKTFSSVAGVNLTAHARGGDGGDSIGGAAVAAAHGSAINGPVTVKVTAEGGRGGPGYWYATGYDGASISLTNAATGSTSGSLTLQQTAQGGSGGYSEYGAGGKGGNATSTLTLNDTSASSLDITSQALGGMAGSSYAVLGIGGAATSSVTASGIGPVRLQSQATGGDGNPSNPSGGRGGSASAYADGTSTGHAAVTVLATSYGGNFNIANAPLKGAAQASAIAGNTSIHGVGASARSEAYGGEVQASAQSFTKHAVLASSTAVAIGSSGVAQASSQTTGLLGRSVMARASSQVSGGSYGEAKTQTAIGRSGAFWLAAPAPIVGPSFSYAAGDPAQRWKAQALATHANVDAAVQAAGLEIIGAGRMGASGAALYSASAQFTFTLDAPSEMVLGLLDFTGSNSGGAFDLTFNVSNLGSTLLTQSFMSLADAQSYFTDHALSLGNFSGSVDLLITLTANAVNDQWVDFNYLLAAGPASTPGPIPEPSQWLMLLAGLGIVSAWARRMREWPCARAGHSLVSQFAVTAT